MSKPRKQDGVVYSRKDGRILWIRYRDRNGKPCRESTQTEDWQEANRKLRERLLARDGNLLEAIRKGEALDFGEWVDSFLENYSKPPIRAYKTHEAYLRCTTHLKAAFPGRRLMEITADAIEDYLRNRLRQRVRVKVAGGYREKGILKSTTVHQEFRVLRRMLNVAVRKKLLAANPCSGVEFPVAVKGLFRPHYVTWSEQEQIEAHGPEYLKNAVQIITETGLRVYKELTSMKKDQVDLPTRSSGSRTLRLRTVPPKSLSLHWPLKPFGGRWPSQGTVCFCSPAIEIGVDIKPRSRRFGARRFGGRRFHTSASTIFAPPMPRG